MALKNCAHKTSSMHLVIEYETIDISNTDKTYQNSISSKWYCKTCYKKHQNGEIN